MRDLLWLLLISALLGVALLFGLHLNAYWNAVERGASYFDALGASAALATAVATITATLGALYYAMLTRRIWAEAAKEREAGLMLQLLHGYDELGRDVTVVARFWADCLIAHESPTGEFQRRRDHDLKHVDDARFNVSRFFVRARKLAKAGYLTEDILVGALDATSVRIFVNYVDRLDQVKAGESYSAADHEFYSDLLARRYQQ